ncbi:MSMEG_0565 family glycosyltransferase [Solicola sp. PLA-1-18]|uniref:MSMEG_0565 family glycosyltransferase n=1 Tax=Solicola sp. PLA-1-18 TaxID=3380532 RepID=UPI003B7B116F
MRIALLTYSTKPRGGVVHTLALAEALARAGHDVDVWTLGRGGDTTFFRRVDPAVVVHAVPLPDVDGEGVGPRILRSIAVLREAFDPRAYDIVHAQDCISANAALPCLRTVHHLDVFTTPELAACHDRAVREPAGLVCVSASVAAEVRDGWGREATVIPNGVDAGRFTAAASPGATGARARWTDELGRYVLALGGIEPRKGTLDLLEAYALLREDHPDVRLVLAGGETLFDYREYRATFDRRVTELGVEPVMLGVVDDDDVPSLVAAASAMGFVSTKEGFGLAAMESLAAGVPVVTRDLPVLREVFGDAVAYGTEPAGFAAALERVLTAPPDPVAGVALACSYTWDAAAARHLELYRRHLA